MTTPDPPGQLADPVGPLVQALLACLCDQLPGTLAGPAVMCCPRPGLSVPAELCCQDVVDGQTGEGHAWVRANRIYPTTTRFPQPQAEPLPCTSGWAAELAMGVWRCAAVVGDDGEPPSCEDITRDALVTLSDAAAMRAALACCFTGGPVGADNDRIVIAGDWAPLGPNGGCVGGALTVTVQFYDCPCP
jgi:hypothetical protein